MISPHTDNNMIPYRGCVRGAAAASMGEEGTAACDGSSPVMYVSETENIPNPVRKRAAMIISFER